MSILVGIFCICFGIVAYTYVGYGVLLGAATRMKPRPWRRGPFHGTVSVVLAVRNEEAHLQRRLCEMTEMLQASGVTGEIIVVSNGSTDRTVAMAREFVSVRVLDLAENGGKAAALSAGAALAKNEILVFADVRQTWAADALTCLLENFADPDVGAVSGDLVLESAPGVLAGVGLYWRYEKWLRKQESLLFSQVGVTGAISAVRRALFKPIPANTVLDDVYWPLQVALEGQRVVHDERALAFDRLPDRPSDEFRRKIRTLAGNFQLLARLPRLLVPLHNPVWWQFLSHKLLRLAAPWMLLGMLVVSWFLTEWAHALFWAQVASYGLAGVSLTPALSRRSRLAAAAGSFLVLNAAAWLAFWVWVSGRTSRSWGKVVYSTPMPGRTPIPAGLARPGAKLVHLIREKT